MKNKSESRTKRLVIRLFNVRSWVDQERLRAGGRYIVNACGTWLNPRKIKKTESFLAAIARLKLTQDMLLVRQQGLLRLSLIMASLAFVLFLYVLYNVFYAHYLAVLLSAVVMLLALVLAFRYHFWYFQIKRQKLGCSLYEWFRQGILGAQNDE